MLLLIAVILVPLERRPCRLGLLVDDAELERRRSGWKWTAPNYASGVLTKYAALVSGADRGAVCTVPVPAGSEKL